MTKNDIVKLLCYINSIYRKKFDYPSGDNSMDTLTEDAWMSFLSQVNADYAMAATRSLMMKSPEWPPSAPQIFKKIQSAQVAKVPSPIDAWEMALKIIKRIDVDAPMIVRDAIQKFGRETIAKSRDQEIRYVMNDFKRMYAEMVEEYEDAWCDMQSGYSQIVKANGKKEIEKG